MNHPLCAAVQCPFCFSIPVQMRQAVLDIKGTMRTEINQLKSEVEQHKKAAHEWEMNWASERAANAVLVLALMRIAQPMDQSKTYGDWARQFQAIAIQALLAAKQDEGK